jgi:hypothetical protein
MIGERKTAQRDDGFIDLAHHRRERRLNIVARVQHRIEIRRDGRMLADPKLADVCTGRRRSVGGRGRQACMDQVLSHAHA